LSFFRLHTSYQIATLAALALLCTTAADGHSRLVGKIDLQSELCSLDRQQKENDPAAFVDFLSEDEIVVSTICNVGEIALSRRDDSELKGPNHVTAVILDASTGAIRRRFDWPTQGRSSMLRVTHAGELLLVRSHLIQLLTPTGELIRSLRIPTVGAADTVFVGLSPALDTMVVTESSEFLDGKTINGVAVLDSRTFDVLDTWHDDGDSWNIAASRDLAVRTSDYGKALQIRRLDSSDKAVQWRMIWSELGAPIPRPVFVNDRTFAILAPNGVLVFSSEGSMIDRVDCPFGASRMNISRNGEIATACAARRYPSSNEMGTFEILTRGPALRQHSHGPTFSATLALDHDLALSPTGARVAIVDQLVLSVFRIDGD
jgi:hypothetical protein